MSGYDKQKKEALVPLIYEQLLQLRLGKNKVFFSPLFFGIISFVLHENYF